MSEHYSGNDPETGCAIIMIGAAVFTLALYVGSFLLLGWRGPLTLFLASCFLFGVIGIILGLTEDKPLPPRTW